MSQETPRFPRTRINRNFQEDGTTSRRREPPDENIMRGMGNLGIHPEPEEEVVVEEPEARNIAGRTTTSSNPIMGGIVVGGLIGLVFCIVVLLPKLGNSQSTTNTPTSQSAAPVAYATSTDTPTATAIPSFPMPSSDVVFRIIADGYTSSTYSYFIQSIVGILPLQTNNPQPYSAEYCVAYNWNNTFQQGTDVKIFSLQFDPTTHAYSASSQSDYSNSCGSASDIGNNPGVIHIKTPTAPIPSSATMESLIASYNATQVNQISITLTAGYYLYTCGSEGQAGVPTQGIDYIFYYDQQGQWRVVSSGAVGC